MKRPAFAKLRFGRQNDGDCTLVISNYTKKTFTFPISPNHKVPKSHSHFSLRHLMFPLFAKERDSTCRGVALCED